MLGRVAVLAGFLVIGAGAGALERPTTLIPHAGSQSLLETTVLVTWYGNPHSGNMGVLGRQTGAERAGALRRQAAAYASLTGKCVLPAYHLVAVVAPARLPRSPDERPVLPERSRRLAAVERRSRAGEESTDWLRVSGLQPVAEDIRARERRTAAPVRQSPLRRYAPSPGGRGARGRRSRGSHATRAQPDVGRAAAAGRHCPRPRERPCVTAG